MKPRNVTFDLYLLCATCFGWILFTWVFFVVKSVESSSPIEPFVIALVFLLAVGAAFTAAATRNPSMLVATSTVCFSLLTVFMLTTNYFTIWTQPNAALSLLCVLSSIYIQLQGNNSPLPSSL